MKRRSKNEERKGVSIIKDKQWDKDKDRNESILLVILLILGCYSCYCIDIKSIVILGEII